MRDPYATVIALVAFGFSVAAFAMALVALIAFHHH